MDTLSSRVVAGYAINLRDVSRHLDVQVFVAGRLAGSGKCDLFRDDLVAMGVGDGRCGFSVELDDPLVELGALRVVVAGESGEIVLPVKPGLVIISETGSQAPDPDPSASTLTAETSVVARSSELRFLDGAAHEEQRHDADRLWRAGRWLEAAAAYRSYVSSVADDATAWRRIAECARAVGELTNAEAACRLAIRSAPSDAAHHLLHGDLLKELQRFDGAAAAYLQSFALLPTRAAALRAEALGSVVDIDANPVASRPARLFLEVSDLLHVMFEQQHVYGIQRVQLGLVSHVLDCASTASETVPRLVIWGSDHLYEISARALAQVLASMPRNGADMAERRRLINAMRDEAIVFRACPGDIVLVTGAMWLPEIRTDVTRGHARLKRAGVRLGIYFYDFIPLTDPGFCHSWLTKCFAATFADAILHCDFALTISDYVARELSRLLETGGYPAIPTKSVPLAHSFGVGSSTSAPLADSWDPLIEDLRGSEYVLSVSSISAHKNHLLLFHVWQLLLHRGIEPPPLVIIGKRGFGSDELFRQLETTRFLDGRIRVLEDVSDETLSQLYSGCLFTMFPSFTEGWGLPVGESLAHGKLCIASSTTAIPEVGGDFVVYVDPFNTRGCMEVVADLLADRPKLRKLEKRVREEFSPRTWTDFGRTLVSSAWALGRDEAPATPVLALEPGQVLQPHAADPAWLYGMQLPPRAAFAPLVLSRAVLTAGWSEPGLSGTWMTGSFASLLVPVAAAAGEAVTIVLQLRAMARARIHLRVTATSNSGTTASSAIAGGTAGDLVLLVTTTVDATGCVELRLAAAQGTAPADWVASVAFVRMIALSAAARLDALAPHHFLRTAALTGDPGVVVPPLSGSLLVAAARRRAPLLAGWQEPVASCTWMDGCFARLGFAAEGAPASMVRVALRLYGRPGSLLRVTATAGNGASATVSPSEADLPGFLLWLDCVVDADGRVGIALSASDLGASVGQADMQAPLAILGLAYGAVGGALAEALMFPPPEPDMRRELLDIGLRFTVTGHMKGSYSLASVNRCLALALEAYKPGSVRIDQFEGARTQDLSDMPAADRVALAPLAGPPRQEDRPAVVICQHWPVLDHVPVADLALAYVFWEESRAPADMIRRLNANSAGVLVPARSVGKALIDSGLSVPVRTVGMAPVLSAFLELGERRAAAGLRRHSQIKPFTFLHVSSCFPRKGADALMQAFAQAFSNADPVRLVIKTFPNLHNTVPEQLAALLALYPAAPEIQLINQDLPLSQMLALYRDADAMVLPTRGEGFNLPAAEALAAGLPLIVTGFGGQVDFVSGTAARTIDYSFSESRSHLNSLGSVWADPDVDDLAAAMREAFAEVGTAAATARMEIGRGKAARLADREAWARRITAAAADMLCAIRPAPPKVALVTTWMIRCGIAEYSRLLVGAYPDAVRDITVLCNDDPTVPDISSDRYPPVKVAWKNRSHASMEQLAVAIQETKAPVVLIEHHLALIEPLSLSLLLTNRRLAACHFVVTLHNVQELFDAETKDQLIAALRRVSRVLVHTIRDLNLLKARGLVDNVAMFSHGATSVDAPPPAPRPLPLTAAPLIGAYGFFLPHKGLGKLVEAMVAIRGVWPLARLRMVTAEYPNPISAAELARCRHLASRLGLSDAIEWHTEFLPDERSLALLSECDLLVLPYDHSTESSSAAVRTAIASRAPVAVTPVAIFNDVSDLVFRLSGTDVADIANGIIWLLEQDGARRSVQERVTSWLASNSWTVVAERLRGMLTGLVAHRGD